MWHSCILIDSVFSMTIGIKILSHTSALNESNIITSFKDINRKTMLSYIMCIIDVFSERIKIEV